MTNKQLSREEFSRGELLKHMDDWIIFIKQERDKATLNKYWEIEVRMLYQIRKIIEEYPYLEEEANDKGD